jgi:hypothetical protein
MNNIVVLKDFNSKFLKYILYYSILINSNSKQLNSGNMTITIKNVLLLLLIITGISSCYPIDDLAVEDLDVAATIYDKTYYDGPAGTLNKFENLQTFTVVDTIVHIVESGTEDVISRSYDDFVLEQVRLNMLKLGFTEEPNPDVNPADVAITVSALMSTHEVYTWYPYWGWYWGYGSYPYKDTAPGFKATQYYYYPWPPYSTYYTYQSGSVLLEMVDIARVNPDVEEIPVIWAGIVNGVLESSSSGIKSRLSNGIDQCFNQSPYLIKNLE